MRATINGAELYYEVLGDDDAPAIVVFHGGPGLSDHRKGKEAYRSLTDDYRLVVYDHRGSGQSSRTPPFTHEQLADDAEALRDHLGIDEWVVIGGSYGGFIAQEYALRHPEHLRGVVLRDTAATPEHRDRAREIAAERIPEVQAADLDVPEVTKESFDRMMEGRLRSDEEFRRTYHSVAPLYAPSLDDFDAAATRETIESLNFRHETHNAMFSREHPEMDYTADLPDVSVPFLVTVGRHDWITPVEFAEQIADLVPDSRLVVFEESGHSPNLDEPAAYEATVREFLEEIGFAPDDD
jgi:proline iminopeptidase